MTPEELDIAVKNLEDIEEIENMHREYVFWFNNRDWDLILTCFAQDAEIEIDIPGFQKDKGEINKLFLEYISKEPQLQGRQIVDQPVITVDGDRAKGYWVNYRFLDIPSKLGTIGQVVKWEQGRYDCEYVREEGNWKFYRMNWIPIWPDTEWFEDMSGILV